MLLEEYKLYRHFFHPIVPNFPNPLQFLVGGLYHLLWPFVRCTHDTWRAESIPFQLTNQHPSFPLSRHATHLLRYTCYIAGSLNQALSASSVYILMSELSTQDLFYRSLRSILSRLCHSTTGGVSSFQLPKVGRLRFPWRMVHRSRSISVERQLWRSVNKRHRARISVFSVVMFSMVA